MSSRDLPIRWTGVWCAPNGIYPLRPLLCCYTSPLLSTLLFQRSLVSVHSAQEFIPRIILNDISQIIRNILCIEEAYIAKILDILLCCGSVWKPLEQ